MRVDVRVTNVIMEFPDEYVLESNEMKRIGKLISVAAALTIVVALSGCITSFIIDIYLDPHFEVNQVIIVSYSGTGDGTIIKATHVEVETATGMTYTYDMFTDPTYWWIFPLTVPSGTSNMIVCNYDSHHPGNGWTHTVTLVIQDIDGTTAEATVTKSI